MARNHANNVKNESNSSSSAPKFFTFKKMLSDVANFVIYDKSDDYIINDSYLKDDDDENDDNNHNNGSINNADNTGSIYKFNKAKKYNRKKKYFKSTESVKSHGNEFNDFVKTFDSVKQEQHKKRNYSYGYNTLNNSDNSDDFDDFDSMDDSGKPRDLGDSDEFDNSDNADIEHGEQDEFDRYGEYDEYGNYIADSHGETKTAIPIPEISFEASETAHGKTNDALPRSISAKFKANGGNNYNNNTNNNNDITSRKRFSAKINLSNTVKRFLILIFSVICGSISMPFGMNPLGISILCAADKYIFYIYAGLVISLAFYQENAVLLLLLYTIIAGIKFFLRYNKEKAKVQMLSVSPSYKSLSGKEKVKLMRLVHFNDAGSVIMAVLVCAVSCCVIGFIRIALRIENLVYTDLIEVILFALISLLFTYLYCGLFDLGTDDKTLEKAGTCSVIFTVVYFLAPYYIYTISIGYICSFIFTLIAANSGMSRPGKSPHGEYIRNRNKIIDRYGNAEDDDNEDSDIGDNNDNNGNNNIHDTQTDEEIINRFAVNTMNSNGMLSDMTRGALIGLLCGIALGDTAGAVTLGICGLISGLFFSQSATLALISGLISAISYSVYIAGLDALQRYIPNMVIGMSVYLPVSMFYYSLIRRSMTPKNAGSKSSTSGVSGISEKPASFRSSLRELYDRGLLVTELPAVKLNSLSDAFNSLSGVFYEFSDRLKNPPLNEIKSMVSAAVEKSCGTCKDYGECKLRERSNLSDMHKKSSDYVHKNQRIDNAGITKIFMENCLKISDIKDYINSVYCRRTEENIANDKTKIFASNFESISKLLQNNVRTGKEDIAFKKEMSEKIFMYLENMGIECENVIVIGERKKTVYIFGIKMVNYSGTITDITEMFEKVCGTCFGDPEYILRENYIIMKNQSRNKFRIYSAYMSKSASEVKTIYENSVNSVNTENINNINNADKNIDGVSGFSNFDELNELNELKKKVNGDSVSVFEGNDGYQYGLISDGMGSGKNAALSSRLTILLMEKLLSAGNQKDLTLEMLNSLLISKNDECFASVDLFEADLITGKASFIKAGAAPSFVVRGGRLFKIQSSTVPAGIIGNINSEQTKFDIEEGDYILMLSDGIISTFEEGTWLLDLLSSEINLRDPKTLLNGILTEAAHKNNRKDDMSVLFLKITEDKRMTG